MLGQGQAGPPARSPLAPAHVTYKDLCDSYKVVPLVEPLTSLTHSKSQEIELIPAEELAVSLCKAKLRDTALDVSGFQYSPRPHPPELWSRLHLQPLLQPRPESLTPPTSPVTPPMHRSSINELGYDVELCHLQQTSRGPPAGPGIATTSAKQALLHQFLEDSVHVLQTDNACPQSLPTLLTHKIPEVCHLWQSSRAPPAGSGIAITRAKQALLDRFLEDSVLRTNAAYPHSLPTLLTNKPERSSLGAAFPAVSTARDGEEFFSDESVLSAPHRPTTRVQTHSTACMSCAMCGQGALWCVCPPWVGSSYIRAYVSLSLDKASAPFRFRVCAQFRLLCCGDAAFANARHLLVAAAHAKLC